MERVLPTIVQSNSLAQPNTTFSEWAGLRDDWPTHNPVLLTGKTRHARTYWNAAHVLWANRSDDDTSMLWGPVCQNVGHTCELTLKALLFGTGVSDKELRGGNFGHSLQNLQERVEAEALFDRDKLYRAVEGHTRELPLPEHIVALYARVGRSDLAEAEWRDYSGHLLDLHKLFHRPFTTRYFMPGHKRVPEPQIILTWEEIMLNAMGERLGLPPLRPIKRQVVM